MNWQAIIAAGEQRTVEFKSGWGPLPDRDLIDTVVCLTNGGGGYLFVGVGFERPQMEHRKRA